MAFEPTSWTLVRQSSSGDAAGQAALDELCRRYWQPLYLFARHTGRSDADAEDDVQSFLLAAAIEGEIFSAARADQGRLRTFLLTAFKRHLIDGHRAATAQKRGGNTVQLSFDEIEPSALDPETDPDTAFDQQWALNTVRTAESQLQARYTPKEFAAYRPYLLASTDQPYDSSAAELGISANAFKVGVHRIRKRFHEELTKVVSDTVDESGDVQDEMSYLLQVLSRCV